MKAVIMAGGDGNRLRPLTCDLPKPMARLLGRPILEYIIELLAENGVNDASITLRYLPGRIIDHFPNGGFSGVKLDFIEERSPLGTAGSVKNACKPGDDGVLVISGDAMCDFDLAAFAKYHREQNADVTILSKRVTDPREYGLVDVDAKMNVTGFIEKPAFTQAVSDLANTGIYILSARALDMIPNEEKFDFAKDLFPRMLERGMKLACWEGDGYWCDIGDLETYIQCQRDMLEGKVRCNIHGTRDQSGNILASSRPVGKVGIIPPVYIGRHVQIEDGASIESGSVIDDGCFVGSAARVTGSILLPDCYVASKARLTGALICGSAAVKEGSMLFEGATVGAGAILGENVIVNAGVKIWNQKKIPDGVTVSTHVKTAVQSKEFFDENGITGQIGVEFTPEFCARLGAAAGSLMPGSRLAVGCSPHHSARVMTTALCAGIQSAGTHLIDFGDNFYAQFVFSMGFCAAPMGVFIRGGRQAAIQVLGPGGLPATREMERNIEGILSRGEFVRCSCEEFGESVEMPGMTAMYKSQLLRFAPRGLGGVSAQVKCRNLTLKNTMREILSKLGCDMNDGPVLEFSSQGDKMRIFDPVLGYIPHHKILTWCAMHRMRMGDDVAIPFDAPHVIDDIAQRLGRKSLRYFTCTADDSDQDARRLAKSQLWTRDALMQAVMFLDMTRSAGGIRQFVSDAPDFDRMVRTVDTRGNPATLIQGLSDIKNRDGRIGEGIVLESNNGIVLVRPLKRGTGIRIMAEAVSAELASELCDDIEKKIRKKMK